MKGELKFLGAQGAPARMSAWCQWKGKRNEFSCLVKHEPDETRRIAGSSFSVFKWDLQAPGLRMLHEQPGNAQGAEGTEGPVLITGLPGTAATQAAAVSTWGKHTHNRHTHTRGNPF